MAYDSKSATRDSGDLLMLGMFRIVVMSASLSTAVVQNFKFDDVCPTLANAELPVYEKINILIAE
jgi:hypothetical protein